MKRVLALGALVTVAAGCGGASTESAALEYAHEFGGKGKPTVLRVEHGIQLANGSVYDVVVLKGRFCNIGGFPGAAPTQPRCGERLAEMLVTAGSHERGPSTIGLGLGDENSIGEARKARPFLSGFPDLTNLLVTCHVPALLAGKNVEGTCYSEGGRGTVSFIAHWPLSKPSGTRNVGGWIVHLGPGGTVLGVTVHRHGPLYAWRPGYRARLTRLAYHFAKKLGDPGPQRVRIRIGVPAKPPFNSPGDVIELWGNFSCSSSMGWCTLSPRTIHGRYARIELDPYAFGTVRGIELGRTPAATAR